MATPSKHEETSASRLLMRAASVGDLSAVNDQLTSGADVNFANEAGQTVLMLATIMGHERVATRLIEAGADTTVKDRLGLTALEWSKRRGFSEITEVLTRLTSISLQPTPAKSPATSQIDSETTTPEPVAEEPSPPLSIPESEPALKIESAKIDEEPSEETSEEVTEVTSVKASVETSVEAEPVVEQVERIEPPVPPAPTKRSREVSDDYAWYPSASATNESYAERLPTEADSMPLLTRQPKETAPPVSTAAPDAAPLQTEPSLPAPPNAPPSQTELSEPDAIVAPPLQTEPSHPARYAPPSQTELSEPPPPDTPPLQTEPSHPAAIVAPPSQTELSQPPPPDTPPLQTEPSQPPQPDTPPLQTEPSQPAAVVAPPPQTELSEPEVIVAPPLQTEPGRPAAMVTPPALDDVPPSEEEETVTRPKPSLRKTDELSIKPAAPTMSFGSEVKSEPAAKMSTVADRPSVFSGSPLGLGGSPAKARTPEKSNLKRCPKCNTIYQNTPLLYCSRDYAPLTGIESVPTITSPETSSAPIAIWLLIAFVLGASAFGAYRLTQYFSRPDEPVPIAAKPVEPPPVEVKKPSFNVGGDLAGTEVNVPEPEYPAELHGTGIGGPITVRVRVNKDGRVISAATTGGDRQLRTAAVKAARRASFAPDKLAEANSRNRVISGTITYDFAPPQVSPATSPTTSTGATTVSPTPSTASKVDPNAPVLSESLASAALDVPRAEYPERVRRAGIEESITITVRVNRAGRVISWRSSSGNSQLRAAAVRAARKASFSRDKLPGTGDVVGTITYNFTR